MSDELFEALGHPRPGERERIAGVVPGLVSNNQDPDSLGRVKVRFAWPDGGNPVETGWARVLGPGAGDTRGLYLLPEVGDEVLVAFERGDPRLPYVLGGLWSTNASPPEDNQNGTNDHRSITSRSGHVVRLDDTQGSEQIEIADGSGNNHVVIATSDNSIHIEAQGDIVISTSGGKLTLKGTDVEITASNSAKVQGATLDLEASGNTTIKGGQVSIN